MGFTLEVCVDSVESAIIAQEAGATRLEVCGNLCIGGTTPTVGLLTEIKKHVSIPCHVLIRPRFGDFLYSEHEIEMMCKDIEALSMADGFVIGVLDRMGKLDQAAILALVKACGNKSITLHRCIDMCKDAREELAKVSKMGITSVLTSGGCFSASEGLSNLEMYQREYPDLKILVGAGVNAALIESLREDSLLRYFHMSGKKIRQSEMVFRNDKVSMGLPNLSEYEIYSADYDAIYKCKQLLIQKFGIV